MLPGSGTACDEDAASFDGWYTDRAAAAAVMQDWVKRFPHWLSGWCTRIKFGSVLVIIRCFARIP